MSNIFKVKDNKRLVRQQYKLNIETPETDHTYADIIYDKPHKDCIFNYTTIQSTKPHPKQRIL